MTASYFAELQRLCQAEDWSPALDFWLQADSTSKQNPAYIFSGMQIAAALWRHDVQERACSDALTLNIPPQGLLQVIQAAVYYYQYESIRTLISYALDKNCFDQNTILPIGAIASRFNAVDLAIQCFEKALALGINSAMVTYNLATTARFKGDKERCHSYLEDCLAESPGFIDAHYTLSYLKTWSHSDNHINTLENLLKSTQEPLKIAQIHYALSKEHEDCQDYDAAFEAMHAGGQIVKQQNQFNIESELEFLTAIENNYPILEKTITQNPLHDIPCKPIFICGLPRTGSTLLERMLAQHSAITSAGELNQFADLFMRRANKQFSQQQLSTTDMVAASTKLDYATLARDYLYSLDPAQSQASYIIDKMPQNSLFVGPILSALPQAKVILVDRHPLDACVAMYKQIFQGIYEFSYELNDLGLYVRQIRQLMSHWQTSYPENVLIVSYEQVVTDTEQTLRNVCGFLELDFETECLNFQNSYQVSATASATQVREKVYSSSIGKWRAYERHLVDLKRYFPEFSS